MSDTEVKNTCVEILEEMGYCVNTLWHIEDVKQNYPNLSDEDARKVLEDSLSNGRIINEVFETIDIIVEDYES